MNLYQKIMAIYPALTPSDFFPNGGILLQNDLDTQGEYIAQWEHPIYACPTDAELEEVGSA
jgi:hypothetical protein